MLDGGSTSICGHDATLVFTASQTTFDCTDIGTVTVTLTVTDINGNAATCNSTITVEDTPLSLANCPADINLTTNSAGCTAQATWTDPVTNCTATLSSTYNSGDFFPLGTTVVTYAAKDALGNTETCSFNVNVSSSI